MGEDECEMERDDEAMKAWSCTCSPHCMGYLESSKPTSVVVILSSIIALLPEVALAPPNKWLSTWAWTYSSYPAQPPRCLKL